jgi:hypothetical protein
MRTTWILAALVITGCTSHSHSAGDDDDDSPAPDASSADSPDGSAAPLPTNVSFATQIMPIFDARGCVACHSGNGPGKDLGGLQLDGGVPKVYSELVTENPLRVQTATPEKSLVLTMPSAENPPDAHPVVTFTSAEDPDYLKLLVWIREGAKNN